MNPVGGLLLGNFIAEPLGAEAPAHARAASGDDRDLSSKILHGSQFDLSVAIVVGISSASHKRCLAISRNMNLLPAAEKGKSPKIKRCSYHSLSASAAAK